MKQRTTATDCRLTPLASVIALTGIANAGIIVTGGHIVGGSATGTLVAIDTPHISNANGTTGSFGGPSWTTGGTITAHPADQGFAALSSPSGDGIREFDIAGTSWEPNGTPFSQARGYYIYPDGPSPGTTWTFNLAGSGIIGSTADKLSFTYQMLTGDGEIIARISTLQDTGALSRVGVMIRDSLAPNSKQILIGMGGASTYVWDQRTDTAGATTTITSGTGTVPNTWVRLVRSGTTITAYTSADGSAWTAVGSATDTTFATTCYIGLAVGSGSEATRNTSGFSNVIVTP